MQSRTCLLLASLMLLSCAAPQAKHAPAAAPTPATQPARPAPAKTYHRQGRYWVFVENITHAAKRSDSETGRAVRLWVALPLDRPGQRVKLGAIHPAPAEVLRDKDTGNQVIYWEVKDPPAGGSLVFHYDFEVTNHALTYSIDPDRVQRVPASAAEHRRFTRSEPWVEVTPEIKKKALEIVGDERNPWRQARRVFDWVVEQVTYDYPDVKSRGVKTAFARLKGDCGEFSHIFIAMMRALGVPARSVVAVWYQGSGHAWAEMLLPPYGWVPVDTSAAQLVKNGLKGQMKPDKVREFMETRGIPTRDPRWLLGNLYPHRLEVFVGDHVTFRSKVPGGTRTFHFLQPGVLAGWPPPRELVGLDAQTVTTGFYLFDEQATDENVAKQRAELELAPMYLAAKLHARALPGLQRAVQQKPRASTKLFQLGQAYFNLERFEEAIATFERAIAGEGGSTKPTTDTWARIIKGMSHDALGQRQQALACYQAAIASGVDFAGAQKVAKGFVAKPYQPAKKTEKSGKGQVKPARNRR